MNYRGLCAHERNRTFTSLRMADFESAASTNSATWAFLEVLPRIDFLRLNGVAILRYPPILSKIRCKYFFLK